MNTTNHNSNISKGPLMNEGFIALMATIIISVILLVMAVQEGSAGWYARFNVLGTEAKEQANALAEGCADQALAALITDPSYRGDVATPTTGGTCYVFPILLNSPTPGYVTIKTQAVVRNSYTNLRLTMNMNEIHFGEPTVDEGTLRVRLQVVNDSGGAATAGQWTLDITPGAATPNHFAASDSAIEVIVPPGSYSVSTSGGPANYTVSASADCSDTIAAGQIKTCTIVADDPIVNPLDCAETVMMLDRTSSIQPATLSDERQAAISLINAYATVLPAPAIGLGVFGDGSDDTGLAPARIVGQLGTNYASLISSVNTWLANSSGLTNLGDAILKANNELNSARHDPTKKKVLILLSDGTSIRPVNPLQYAHDAADTAKKGPDGIAGIPGSADNADDTDIFAIYYSSTPQPLTRDYLAQLASGPVPYPPYQPGALSDTGDATGYVSPTLQAVDTGGDNNGFEVAPTNALADGPSGVPGAAQNIDGQNDRHRYYGYDFSIPPDAIIRGIQVRLDWWLDDIIATNSMGVELSWDGGTSWTSAKLDTSESTLSTHSVILGGSNDNTWGHVWTPDQLSPANFRVRVISNSTSPSRDFYLDWVPVQVSYNQENTDDDRFFIAPTSAAMPDIFHSIGVQVCPAILGDPPNPTPTTTLPPNFNINLGTWQEVPRGG